MIIELIIKRFRPIGFILVLMIIYLSVVEISLIWANSLLYVTTRVKFIAHWNLKK